MEILERHPVTLAPVVVVLTPKEEGVIERCERFITDGMSPSDALIHVHAVLRREDPAKAKEVLSPAFCDWLIN